jgi:hypothetical protein
MQCKHSRKGVYKVVHEISNHVFVKDFHAILSIINLPIGSRNIDLKSMPSQSIKPKPHPEPSVNNSYKNKV